MRTDIVDNVNDVESRPTGNTEQAAIRRLRKDRPDLLERVITRPWRRSTRRGSRTSSSTASRKAENTGSQGSGSPGFRGSVDPSRCNPVGAQKRKPVSASKERPVKTTVSLDVDLHSRLSAMASRRRTSISALAESFIREGLRGFVVIDRSESSDRGKGNDRPSPGLGISSDADDEAA